MTVIITKKRKTLSLNRGGTQGKEKKPELTGQQRGEEHNKQQKKESQRQYLACKDWVYNSWPHLFDLDNVKPLAIGIIKNIQTEYDKKGGFEVMGFYRNSPFKKVMFGWTRRKAYQRALAKDGAHRYNLDNEPIEQVSERDKQAAIERLEQLKMRDKK